MDLPGRRVVDVDAPHLDLPLTIGGRTRFDVRLAEDHEEVAGAGLLEELVTHREIGVHGRLEDGQPAKLAELACDVSVEREATHDEEVGEVDSLSRGLMHELSIDCAVFRANGDRGALLGPVLAVGADCVDVPSGPGLDAIEHQALRAHRVLDAGLSEVIEHNTLEALHVVVAICCAVPPVVCRCSREWERDVWGKALNRERSCDTNNLLVLVWLVVQGLLVGMASNGYVNLFAGHPLADVRIVRDGLQSNVGNGLVDESLAQVAARNGVNAIETA